MSLHMGMHPFYLTKEDIKWIEKTRKNMTIEEKIGQLLFAYGYSHDKEYLDFIVNTLKPGGIMFRADKKHIVSQSHSYLQENIKVPLFISANLESGGNGIIEEGTKVANNMLVGATNNKKYAYDLGNICANEGKDVGVNMSFSPVIDINFNFRNAAVNVRAFGDKVDIVKEMGISYCEGMKNIGVVPTIKHFPGDGVDARDQHAITTYNNLEYSKWMDTFGSVYKGLIDNGARSLMVGHIGLPRYFEKFSLDSSRKHLPASVSKELLEGLLRNDLGYKGLIITDSTLMSGINWIMKRSELVPEFIISGCDMILFTKDPVKDFNYLLTAYKDGRLTLDRIEEALEKILSLKANLKLYKKYKKQIIVNYEQNRKKAKEIIESGITLVRDSKYVLPLSKERYKRILIHRLGNETSSNLELFYYFVSKLEGEGFLVEVSDYKEESPMDLRRSDSYYTTRYDLIIYLANKNVISNQTHLNLELKSRLGIDSPWLVNQIPTLFISLASPYHMYDLPMLSTIINGYFPSKDVIDIIVRKIINNENFKGKTPVNIEELY